MFQSIFKKQRKEVRAEYKAFIVNSGIASWSSKNYENFAGEGYAKNIIAYRCINLIAMAASFVPLKLYLMKAGEKIEAPQHQILKLLNHPSAFETKMDFFQSIYSHKLISGNAYIKAKIIRGKPQSLFVIRPDKVKVLTNSEDEICGYIVKDKSEEQKIFINKINAKCEILHLKTFHPLNDYYGLSAIEAARYAIDQHNEASNYAKSLLQNSARPSGALIVKTSDSNIAGTLTEEQFIRLKEQLDEEFSGTFNAGRPILLEGGLEWKEMSLRPRDMDFIESKNMASREIALAFGVPPQLLGIPGDSTYSNMMEARIALWEQTIIPIMVDVISGLSRWLANLYNEDIVIDFDREAISALTHKRELDWEKVIKADFLTEEEKREFLGFPAKKKKSL